MKILTFRFRN